MRLKRPVSLSTKDSCGNLLNFAANQQAGSNCGAGKSSCVLSKDGVTVRRLPCSERGFLASSDFNVELIERRGSSPAAVLLLVIGLIL
jgi:hypothetical protein